jgi:CMP-N,N'-diacetyllegionaminic acid synthase
LRILALITARGGTKRLPGKNIRLLGGVPLIVWSIEVAKDVPQICDILVSTDDPAIAAIARNAGAMVPWLRPAELATDSATSIDVSLHALDWYERQNGKIDGLLLLQPTSPFRRRATVSRGISLFSADQNRPVVSVSPATSHPMWCVQIIGESLRPYVEGGMHLRSQDLPSAYVLNGAFYLGTPEVLRAQRSFYSEEACPLVMSDPEESIDIDTEWDWMIAEAAVERNAIASRRK